MRYQLVPIALACLLTACSDGVQVQPNDQPIIDADMSTDNNPPVTSAEGAITDIAATAAINHPTNSINEPTAAIWIGTSRERNADCASGLEQASQDAFATDGFTRIADDEGTYLLATPGTDNNTPRYIEFCVTVEQLATHRILTTVLAPSILEDSFFVTIDEDTPGTVAEPGIYDVSRSSLFINDTVRTRTENPLTITLAPGIHVLRFYYREPNTALRGIRLEADMSDTPVDDPGEPGTTDIAQCSANTGLPETEIDSLITQYLGNIQRRFVLSPFDEEREFTIRNDYRWDTSAGRGNIMCLAPPPEGGINLVDNTITEGRIVFGSEGNDEHRAATPLRGTFIGNGGNDRVGVVDGGTFIAGPGNDNVELIRSGRVEAGAGEDRVGVMRGGLYAGGPGNDTLITQFMGTFDGGSDNDSISRQSSSAQSISVEDGGVLFEPLPAPTDIVFTDSTSNSTVVQWTAPPDVRVQGYLLNLFEDLQIDIAIELGAPPGSVSPLNTRITEYVVEQINLDGPVVQVRAYTELNDGSYLYSDPLEGTFVAPDDGGVQPENIIATAELFDTESLISTTLAANGSVLVTNFRAPSNTSTPVFIRLDQQLQNPTPVFNDTLADSTYTSYPGDERQYIARFPREDRGTVVVAFNEDASAVVWEQELQDGGPLNAQGACPWGIVTQDDWLICSTFFTGEMEAFDPDGLRYSQPAGFIETRNTLVDGANGILVEILQTQDRNIPEFSVLNVASGEKQTRSLRLEGIADNVRLTADGLVVDGDHFVLTGSFVLECELQANCGEDVELAQGFYILRALIADGSVSRYTSGPTDSRAGAGIGKLVNDTVVFSRSEGFSRYRADTLELITRRAVPGDVQDIGVNGVLSQQFIGFPLVEGYRLILSAP